MSSQEKPIDLTKYNQPAQAPETAAFRTEPREPGRLAKLGRYLHQKWVDEDRPGLFELHVYYLPVALVMAGAAVNVSDDVLGTHFADDMAQVQVNKNTNPIYQTVEEAVQDIGKTAGGHAKK